VDAGASRAVASGERARRNTNAALDDDAALLALARLALGGPRDEGRSSYQIAVTVCAVCGAGHQPASGEIVPIDPDIVEMAHCDGQHIGRVAPRVANDRAPVGSPTPRQDAHVGVDVHAENAVYAHPGAGVFISSPSTPALPRAKQSIPPALRRAVVARDQRRCRVPGCRNSVYLDVHHIGLRCEGGPNEAENLITVCGAHHRAAHRGKLAIEGTATAVRCRHADGSPYGRVVEPQALEARARTFAALRRLGFREGEVRAVLAQLERQGELTAATTEQWLRAALARLTPPRSRR
jgi:hypothetical protein